MGNRLCPWRLTRGGRSRWIHGHSFHQTAKSLAFSVSLSASIGCPILLYLVEKLGSLRPPVVHERLNILI
jgi:hypothetical protein